MKHRAFRLNTLLAALFITLAAHTATAQDDGLVNLTTGVVGSGTILRDPDQTFYKKGTTISLSAIPDEGFVFQEWSGPVADPLSPDTTILLEVNTLVGATFVPIIKPQLKTSPESGTTIDFGVVETGLLSNPRTQTITITNIGGGTLEGSAALTGTAARPYGIVSGGTFSLAANQTAEIEIRFDPFNTDFRITLNDLLKITSNGGSAELPLTGIATLSGELLACSSSTGRTGSSPWGDAVLILALVILLALTRHSAPATLTR